MVSESSMSSNSPWNPRARQTSLRTNLDVRADELSHGLGIDRLSDDDFKLCNPITSHLRTHGPFFDNDAGSQQSYEDELNEWWENPKKQLHGANLRAGNFAKEQAAADNGPDAVAEVHAMHLLFERFAQYGRDCDIGARDYLLPWAKTVEEKDEPKTIKAPVRGRGQAKPVLPALPVQRPLTAREAARRTERSQAWAAQKMSMPSGTSATKKP